MHGEGDGILQLAMAIGFALGMVTGVLVGVLVSWRRARKDNKQGD